MKVERAKLVERPCEPHFALGLTSPSVDKDKEGSASFTSRPASSHPLVSNLAEKVEKAELVERSFLVSSPSEPHSNDEEQTSTHCLISGRVQLITQLFLHQCFQDVHDSQRKETTDQVARC